MNKKKISLLTTIMLIGLIPLLLVAICLCVISVGKLEKNLKANVYDQLKVAAEGAEKYYSYDLIRTGQIEYDHEYIDSLKNQGIELTIFLEDTRYLTSITDKTTGKRNEGTKADEKIYKQVSSGQDYKAENVIIGGSKYYVYYTPIYDGDGKIAGMSFAGKLQSVVINEIKKSIGGLVVATTVLIVVCGFAIILIARKIERPIENIVGTINTLSDGSLGEKFSASSNIREIDVLIQAAHKLRNSLNTIITNVHENVNSLDYNMNDVANGVETCNHASEGIVCAVEELAKGTVSMADSVQNCTESMYTIGDEISNIANLATNANNNAQEAKDVSNDAKTQLNQLISANSQTISVSKNVVEGIHEASEAAKVIQTAAEAITNIASETNLLSLNASIEAARAGEAGAGFAVVAASIQQLANQSDETARHIQEIITNILDISDNNVYLATNIKDAVDNEGHVLANVSNSFDVVNMKLRDTADAVSSIYDKSVKLDSTKDQVIDEISNLSAISEENAASCEETNASMEELKANVENIHQQAIDTKDVSTQLNEAVAYFKI